MSVERTVPAEVEPLEVDRPAGGGWRRVLSYGALGGALTVVGGKLVTAATGLACACWVGNVGVGLQAGVAGGIVFAFISTPHPFGPPREQV